MKKKVFAILLFLAVLVLCIVRWNTWFGNPPESAYDPLPHVGRVLLTVGPNGNERFVSWQCGDSAQSGWLDYLPMGQSDTVTIATMGKVFHSRAGVGAFFSALMKDLRFDTSYEYRIRVGADTTEWFSFTMPKQDASYAFLYFGDVQDELDEMGLDTLLPEIMKKNSDASMLLFGGDLIERPMDCFWGKVFSTLSPYAQQYPVVSVPGNHEYLKGVVRRLEGRFPLVFPYYGELGPEDNALFSFSMGDARFFLLDSNKDFWSYWSQRYWLEEQLQQCKETWKIVILHHPIISIKGAANNFLVKQFFDGIVRDYGVDLVLQGHEHGYARFNVECDESGDMKEPLRLVTFCSRKEYPLAFHGDVARWGTDSRYYQRISVSDTMLSLETYTADHQLYDRVHVKKLNGHRVCVSDQVEAPERVYVSDWFRKNKSAKRVKEFEENIAKWRSKSSDSEGASH